MTKSIVALCVFALFATVTLAQTIDTLTSATATTGILLPTLTDYEEDRKSNYYKIWVPENAKSVTVNLEKTDTQCSYIAWFVSSHKAPCSNQFSDPTGYSYPCKSALYNYVSSGTDTIVFVPGGSDSSTIGLFAGDWFYVTVSKEATKTDTCQYILTTTVDSCAAGEVGAYSYYSGIAAPYVACLPLGVSLKTADLPYTAEVNITTQYSHNRVWVPQATSMIRFTFTNATSYFYLNGDNNHAASDYYSYCRYSISSGVGSSFADCHFPESGWFYYGFQQFSFVAGDWVDFTYSVELMVCADNLAGYNCSSPAANYVALTAGQSFTVPASTVGTSLEYNGQFFYYDLVNGTSTFANLTATLTAGTTGYISYRRNAFPGYSSPYYISSYDYSSLTTGSESFALTWEDTIVGGRFYFVVLNTGITDITFSTTAATAVSTTAAATTDVGTTGSSSAVSIFAPLALIALLIAALL